MQRSLANVDYRQAHMDWNTQVQKRQRVLKQAVEHLKYPPRPSAPVPASPAVDRLRAVLSEAPRPDPSVAKHPHGIDVHEDHEGDVSYSWAEEYLRDLLPALAAVIDAHGIGDAGWKGVRWEVYEKV